ncbi:N-acetylglucosaminyldiphospho-UDP N-acetyl-beta-D-mannosaminyltransferase [Rhodoferax lacus]|uniref:N-acetylglucosaminyldiphospho-UDP N-acetyl-beta-D-mannosaminyltransferase n=1 Tax=Rhodoferax lacus TaxID=2184758 RepID=A0A3E1RF56_9BURK|nr:WecB/TagA/CpsF family glycosyltransferase [Rhodoferax lacus]RFO97998.1 N-acetylglucosaminyldiphospho-UDP N-acetyl-beta-D-mannosaminyltransferase [Rhodoferax lacus]
MKSTQANFDRKVHCLMGLPFDAITLAQATEQIRQAAFNRTPCFFSTPNLNFLIAAQSNKPFRESVIKSDLSLPDGMPIVWMSRLLGIPITERVAGSDVFDALRKGRGRKIKVYFFGGQPGIAEKAMQILNAEDGGLQCVGFETPGFGSVAEMSTPDTIAKINASGAEFLVVSLGAVKGQAWIEHNLAALDVPVVSHLGAVLNFVAGNVRRAPRWMQNIGLEWVWRIVEEPTLWKRYLNDVLGLFKFGLGLVTVANIRQVLKRDAKSDLAPLELRHVCNQDTLDITVSGACVSKNLKPLKALLGQYANQQLNIRLHVENVLAIDSAYLGLLTLVCGQQLNRGKSLQIEGHKSAEFSFDVVSESA